MVKHYIGQMTAEELKDTKIRIISEAHSKAFQEMCFKAGVPLARGVFKVNKFHRPFIYVDKWIKFGFDNLCFTENDKKEITWTPIDLPKKTECSTHDFSNPNHDNSDPRKEPKLLGRDEIEVLLHGEESHNSPIYQIRAILPESAEVAISQDKITIFYGDNIYSVESMKDIENMSSAINTLEEFKQ